MALDPHNQWHRHFAGADLEVSVAALYAYWMHAVPCHGFATGIQPPLLIRAASDGRRAATRTGEQRLTK